MISSHIDKNVYYINKKRIYASHITNHFLLWGLSDLASIGRYMHALLLSASAVKTLVSQCSPSDSAVCRYFDNT